MNSNINVELKISLRYAMSAHRYKIIRHVNNTSYNFSTTTSCIT